MAWHDGSPNVSVGRVLSVAAAAGVGVGLLGGAVTGIGVGIALTGLLFQILGS